MCTAQIIIDIYAGSHNEMQKERSLAGQPKADKIACRTVSYV